MGYAPAERAAALSRIHRDSVRPQNSIHQLCDSDPIVRGIDTHAIIAVPDHRRITVPLAVDARTFLASRRRFHMGDKSPKNVNKQKKVHDQKKQNAKKQPAAKK